MENEKNKADAAVTELLEGKPAESTYQSHYNTKLKQCLMLIKRSRDFSLDKTMLYEWYLVDAVERRYYAFYGENMRYEGGPKRTFESCELTPSLRQKTLCKTREEFDAFVAEYMEE